MAVIRSPVAGNSVSLKVVASGVQHYSCLPVGPSATILLENSRTEEGPWRRATMTSLPKAGVIGAMHIMCRDARHHCPGAVYVYVHNGGKTRKAA